MKTPVLTKVMFVSNVLMFVTLAGLLSTGFARQQPTVLSVERLNIVDSTGQLALVLANGARLPGAMFQGREYPQAFVGRGRSAGMIFFNEDGDEVGGLIYEGGPRDSTYRAFGHLSFDQRKQNQVVAVQYLDDGHSRSAGVRVWDRPTDAPLEDQFVAAMRMRSASGAARDSLNRERLRIRERGQGASRLFLGSQDRVAKLELRDQQGRIRAQLFVDSSGVARLAFRDSTGRTIAQYP